RRVCTDAHHARLDAVDHLLHVVEARLVAAARTRGEEEDEHRAGTGEHFRYWVARSPEPSLTVSSNSSRSLASVPVPSPRTSARTTRATITVTLSGAPRSSAVLTNSLAAASSGIFAMRSISSSLTSP